MFRHLIVVLCVFLAAPMGAMATSHASSGANASSTSWIRLPGHVLLALAQATVESGGKAKGKEPLTLTLVLKRDDQAGFERYLQDVYDPHSNIAKPPKIDYIGGLLHLGTRA